MPTHGAEGLPPPPPYEPVSRGQSQQPRYAPPPGPPPGHTAPYGASVPNSAPHVPNMMAADPASYLSGQQQQQTHPPPPAAPLGRHDSVSNAANQLGGPSAAGGQGRNPFLTQRQPSIKENQLDFLRTYDTIFVVDDSSSMNVNERPDGSMGQSRWEEARDALAGMVQLAAQYDSDGVDVHFLNSEKSIEGCREAGAVKQLFDSIVPEGTTPTGTKLEMLLLQYMDDIEAFKKTRQGVEPPKRNYVVITDGAASDDPESVIVATAQRLDRGNFPLSQVGIQFVQVGDDAEAREALQELDDAVQGQHACRDIVDTVPYAGMALKPDMIVKALLGGINRRLDRQRA